MGCIESTHDIRTREHRARKYKERLRNKPFRPLSRPCKSGYLLYYTRDKSRPQWRGKWKKVFAILFEDSTIAWFNEPKRREPIEKVSLRSVCSMMLVGPVCSKMHWSPNSVPKKLSYDYMFAFPQAVEYESMPNRIQCPIYYFLCPNGKSMGQWLTSIAGTLPQPPKAIRALKRQPSRTKECKTDSQQRNTESTTNEDSTSLSGFWAETGIGFGYGKPWEWGWGWGLTDYHPCYGWGYDEFEKGKNVDVHDCTMMEFDSVSVASFGGSDFQDYGFKVDETSSPGIQEVDKTEDSNTNRKAGNTNDVVSSGLYSNGMNSDTGISGNFRGIEELDFGMANYDDHEPIGGYSGGGTYGGGDNDGSGAWSGGGWGGGGGTDIGGGGGDSGGASCGGGGCGGGGCGGGGGGGDF